jgi:hypothetical protein
MLRVAQQVVSALLALQRQHSVAHGALSPAHIWIRVPASAWVAPTAAANANANATATAKVEKDNKDGDAPAAWVIDESALPVADGDVRVVGYGLGPLQALGKLPSTHTPAACAFTSPSPLHCFCFPLLIYARLVLIPFCSECGPDTALCCTRSAQSTQLGR